MSLKIKTSAEIFNEMKNLGGSEHSNERWVSHDALISWIQSQQYCRTLDNLMRALGE